MKLLLEIFAILFFSACAPALYNADFSGFANEKFSLQNSNITFSATENGDSVEVPEELKHAYIQHLASSIPEGCEVKISFQGSVEERYASLWYLGIFVLAPLWPAMPREDDIQITAECTLTCDKTVVEKIWLLEEEHPRLFWYGPYRNGFVQDHADMIHRKLISRLQQSLFSPIDNSTSPNIY